jgi:hypothetical protein
MRSSDVLPPIPPCFVSFAWRYQRRARLFAVRRSGALLPRPRALFRRQPIRLPRWRKQDLPGSWRTLCALAPLSDPGGISAPGQYDASMLPPRQHTAKAPTTVLSRLNHAAVALPVYASWLGLPHRHATLGTGWWPTFPGQARPAGFDRKVSVHPSSLPRLCLAHMPIT